MELFGLNIVLFLAYLTSYDIPKSKLQDCYWDKIDKINYKENNVWK